jgi:hypothetical protein
VYIKVEDDDQLAAYLTKALREVRATPTHAADERDGLLLAAREKL